MDARNLAMRACARSGWPHAPCRRTRPSPGDGRGSGWVHLNGKKIAETVFDLEKSPDSWITPVVCDITDLISYEKPNLIAVKVEDQNGAGGLWRLVSMYWEEPEEKTDE